MADTVAELLLWTCLGLVAYSYAVFPVLVTVLARAFGHPPARPATPDPASLPTVAVIVAAFNEEAHIASRIENLLAQDYPTDRLRVLVGSDGSTDRTAALAGARAGPRVEFHDFPVNRGKASVLNDLVAAARAEVLVFTDANTVFQADTVRNLVAALDGRTAAVCGELILQKPDAGSNQDHRYWNAERRLKLAESSLGGLLGANGGVYAIRRERYRPLRPDTICDDFVIAMGVAVEGAGLRYEPSAVAFEDTPDDVAVEFHRRVRIGIGNYQSLFRHPRFLLGGPPMLGFTYFSHKVLRWLTPHLLLVALACSLFLAHRPAYLALSLAMAAGFALAYLVFVTRDRVAWPGLFRAASFFAMLNAAFLAGFAKFLTGNYRGSWRRTAR